MRPKTPPWEEKELLPCFRATEQVQKKEQQQLRKEIINWTRRDNVFITTSGQDIKEKKETKMESNVFKDGKCPMLFTDAIKRYKLSDKFIERFCNKGCSVKCGKLLEREVQKQKGE